MHTVATFLLLVCCTILHSCTAYFCTAGVLQVSRSTFTRRRPVKKVSTTVRGRLPRSTLLLAS